jgi:ATP-dependent Lon protease
VSEIQEMKDRLKQENDNLKKIKHQLKENQEKQKVEKEVRMILRDVFFKLSFSKVKSSEFNQCLDLLQVSLSLSYSIDPL